MTWGYVVLTAIILVLVVFLISLADAGRPRF